MSGGFFGIHNYELELSRSLDVLLRPVMRQLEEIWA